MIEENIDQPSEHKKNIYPLVRHLLLVVILLCTVLIFVFLMYQNGKSIYDNGL